MRVVGCPSVAIELFDSTCTDISSVDISEMP